MSEFFLTTTQYISPSLCSEVRGGGRILNKSEKQLVGLPLTSHNLSTR